MDQNALKGEAVSHFGNIYKHIPSNNLEYQLKVLNMYPRFFNPEEGRKVGKMVELVEIKEVLKKFMKDKSTGLDGRTVEFFLYLFDIVG